MKITHSISDDKLKLAHNSVDKYPAHKRSHLRTLSVGQFTLEELYD
ncbi:MAG: hypothetical protein GY730_08575 [bacterium]|nr:hypothetical protein [bacterium]